MQASIIDQAGRQASSKLVNIQVTSIEWLCHAADRHDYGSRSGRELYRHGQTTSNQITITASATDNIAVSNLVLGVDQYFLASRNSNTLNYALNTASLTNGPHVLVAFATDTSGNTSSTTFNLIVGNVPDTNAPSVTLIARDTSNALVTNNETVSGPMAVTVSGTDDSGLSRLELWIDNGLIATNAGQRAASVLAGHQPGDQRRAQVVGHFLRLVL